MEESFSRCLNCTNGTKSQDVSIIINMIQIKLVNLVDPISPRKRDLAYIIWYAAELPERPELRCAMTFDMQGHFYK